MSESQSLKEIYYRLRYGADGKAGKYARKVEQRKEKFESQRWAQGEDLAARNYENYEEYLKHQAEKLDKYLDRRRGKEDDEYAEFLRRFGMARGHEAELVRQRLSERRTFLSKSTT